MTGVTGVTGVLGGGRMGVGIAHAFLLAGSGLVIGAVPEKFELKTATLRRIENQLTSDAWIVLGTRTDPSAADLGLDVRLGIAGYLREMLGDRFAPPVLLREKVAAGHVGRKTGHGFFTWPTEPDGKETQ